MKRTLVFLTLLAGFGLVAGPAMAQMIYVHGGMGFPSSSAFNNAYKAGYNLGVSVGLPITSQVEGIVRGSYDRFGLDSDFGENDFSSFSATGNLKLKGPMMNDRLMPYALGGAGLFRLGVENNFSTEFGVQVGAGVEIRTSSQVNFLVEPNYVLVLNDGQNTQFFPVRVGASFGI